MLVLRRILLAALCAGLLSGIFAAAAHQLGTVPLILQAESYEKAATPERAHAAGLKAAEWQPEQGFERALFTLAADLIAGVGFALLIAAGLALRGGPVTWREGLFWGLAGFATFTLAPGLGLPPEIPGAAAAPLAERQAWWLATALCTGGGLALIAFARRASWAAAGAALILAPHLYGAPQLGEFAFAAPEALAHRFAVAATLVNFVFWVALGATAGEFYRRFGPGG